MAAAAFSGYKPKECSIQSLDGKKKIDITNSIVSIDYFEDILKPDLSVMVNVINAYSIVSNLPIRGGEKCIMKIETAGGDFEMEFAIFKVSGVDGSRMAEAFTLHLTTKEFFRNETNRCVRKYTGKISESVREILTKILNTDKDIDIESSANSYDFIGSMRKPFSIMSWLGPKAISTSAEESDSDPDGSKNQQAKGTSGFFFYENQDGFHFRSIDGLVSTLKTSEGSSDNKDIFRYSYGGKIIKANEIKNNTEIIDWAFEKNIDLRKALRIGMYCNHTVLYDNNTHQVTAYRYNLKEQIKEKKLSKDELVVEDSIGNASSRIVVRSTDNGIMASGGGVETSGRVPVDHAKSLARYNLLFTQALNILVPCNINLKVGDVIYCEFPEVSSGSSKEIDPETSGYYLIRELRHHFSANQNTTSLKLMRDSYGVY